MKAVQIRQMIGTFKDEFRASTADAGWPDSTGNDFNPDGRRFQSLRAIWLRITPELPAPVLWAEIIAWDGLRKVWLETVRFHQEAARGRYKPIPAGSVHPIVGSLWKTASLFTDFLSEEVDHAMGAVEPVKPKPKRANNCSLVISAIEQWKKANFRGCVIKAGTELPTYRMFCKMAGCAGHANQTEKRNGRSKAAYRELAEAFSDSLAAPKSVRLRG